MEFKENKPIYMQIGNRIAEEILTGRYRSDERIPSVREYAACVEVNANTTMRAYDFLQSKGIIYNKRGVGYFVSPRAAEIISVYRREEFIGMELKQVFDQMQLLNISMDDVTNLYNRYVTNKKNQL